MKEFETVIGLEVHLQLSTKTKIFCGCKNDFGYDPNTLTCPVCLGLPGSLPVFNKKVLTYGIKAGLALNCTISSTIKFDRKNYYYPDLPKAYQISQFDMPIAKDGYIMITKEDGNDKKIRIHRAHLEEDAGKLTHDTESSSSLVDYNRTGTPLLEIVTEPDMSSPQEAYDYLQALKLNLQYLDVSDCDMEKGSLRCDANISIREKGETKLGTKAELKNMNSFKAIKTALEYEVKRQQEVVESGSAVIQETRLWDENKNVTISMRSKEEAHDYRYFPEPDLVPFTVSKDTIDDIKKTLPELPAQKLERLSKEYDLSDYNAKIIVSDKSLALFFEECAKLYKDTKKICNWINGSILSELNNRKETISNLNLSSKNLVDLIKKVDGGILSNLIAKDVLGIMLDTGKNATSVVEEKGLAQVSDDSELEKIVDELIKENENVANQIKEGKESAIGFLVGQAMKKTKGKANPKKIGEIIKRTLS
ncbi:MAG: Asp-tRNA(Asn)/Glu-tRNA(Gln) amidotransferase subunit GatB [Candidatus Zapsychrus exili]|nr:Asp-tRNA(Asn)/Glu-tRNA(Gln) amidotransferase subunit GatB [Candidatus Zapsychrus exili]